MHPIMVANNKKLKCPYYFFGKCLKQGGAACHPKIDVAYE